MRYREAVLLIALSGLILAPLAQARPPIDDPDAPSPDRRPPASDPDPGNSDGPGVSRRTTVQAPWEVRELKSCLASMAGSRIHKVSIVGKISGFPGFSESFIQRNDATNLSVNFGGDVEEKAWIEYGPGPCGVIGEKKVSTPGYEGPPEESDDLWIEVEADSSDSDVCMEAGVYGPETLQGEGCTHLPGRGYTTRQTPEPTRPSTGSASPGRYLAFDGLDGTSPPSGEGSRWSSSSSSEATAPLAPSSTVTAWPMLAGLLVLGALAAVVLYRRITADEALDHDLRSRMVEIVAEEPAVNASTLADRFDVHLRTVLWHGRVLAETGHLEIDDSGGETNFFVPGQQGPVEKALAQARRQATKARILEALRERPGCSMSDLARAVDVHRSTVKHHVDEMVEADLVSKTPSGRSSEIRLADAVSAALDRRGDRVGA